MQKLISILGLSAIIGCGSGGSKQSAQPTPPAPKVQATKDAAATDDTKAPKGAAPLPPMKPTPGKPAEPTGPLITPSSPEGKFLASLQPYRWRTHCDSGQNLFYGVDFTAETWSSLYFAFADSNGCNDTATLNDGSPLTYLITSMKLGADGWYVLEGKCLTAANGCTGTASIGVRVVDDHVEVRKVSATGTYFPAGETELPFDF